LLQYLLERFDHVSVERVCSGIGIRNIYEYLRDVEDLAEPPEVTQLIASARDPAAAIIDSALEPHNPSKLCTATVETFISILASEAANLALKVFATGGLYLAGGIPLHTLSVLQQPRFIEAFRRKGRFAELMEHIPIHVILTRVALVGAATYGLERLEEEPLGGGG
jgi:glucokinase